ncbi:MAG: TIM barrel protein [Candidatus Lokiarchaeota archaeon]|nr:TIM barrel protein [Candidatus Lokiarchaeota archaeon]MBD3339063.1 TIM barrel protein [Candidatus Lokiarchaeota archaeon]
MPYFQPYKLALNQNSCKNLKINEFLKFSKDFKGVELDYEKIDEVISKGLLLKDLKEELEMFGLKMVSLFTLKDFSLSRDSVFKRKILPSFEKMMDIGYRLESNLLVVKPSDISDDPSLRNVPDWRIYKRTTERLEEISKIAQKEDIKIGFEFDCGTSISDFQQAKKVLDPLKSQENLGFVIDTFEFYKSESDINELKDVIDFVYLVQLSDILEVSNKTEYNKDDSYKKYSRVFPGGGKRKIPQFLRLVRKLGYRDYFSIKLDKIECNQNLFKKFYKSI